MQAAVAATQQLPAGGVQARQLNPWECMKEYEYIWGMGNGPTPLVGTGVTNIKPLFSINHIKQVHGCVGAETGTRAQMALPQEASQLSWETAANTEFVDATAVQQQQATPQMQAHTRVPNPRPHNQATPRLQIAGSKCLPTSIKAFTTTS
jgi:hypothetical protein